MNKVSTLLKYILLGVFICFCSLLTAQDFKIQQIQDDIGNSGGTNTSFTAVSSLNNAIALPSNNRKTHAGRSDSNDTALEGDDMAGARVLTGTGTLTYYRESGSISNNMNFQTNIWEYIGTPGGANEFIVRGRYTASLPTGGTGLGYTYVDIDVSGAGIVSPNKVVPFITGIMNDDTNNGADSATGMAHLSSSTNLVVRKGTSDNNVTIYITLVEFTGSNWTVLHGDASSSAATGSITLYDGYDATGTATGVSSWTNALIFTQSKAQTAASGGNKEKIRSQWPVMKPGADTQTVDWSFDASRDTGSNQNRHFIHVINNPTMTVTRFSDTSFADNESTVDITSAGLSDLTQSMVVGSMYTAGNGSGYGQGWRNYYLNSLTQVAHWAHRSGHSSGVSHEIQIVDFVSAPVTTTQGPGGFTAEIQLWLKANTGVEEAAADAAENGDAVLNWLDQSVNSNNATQATGANQPVFTEAAINFNPTVDFDGTNHEMTATTAPNTTMTVFTVAEGTFSSTKSLLNLDNGANGSVDLEQTAGTTIQGSYHDGSATSGSVSGTITSGTPFLVNYDHVTGGNSELFLQGVSQGTASANADNLSGSLTAGIGADPSTSSTRWNGGIAEMVVYNQALTSGERDKVESYFAIKYGITLGANGTSQDYVDSDGTVIWDQSANVGYNYNVTGIGKDDASNLEQKQSKTVNTTDDITVGIKQIATTNSSNSTNYFEDKSFLIWGHNNGSTSTAGTDITKDFSSSTSVTTSVSATPIQRIWKMVVTDTIPTIKLSIPESMVSVTNPGSEEYIMIIADDAAFTTNVTSATMEDVGSDLEVDFYFEGTKYITFGSTAITAEMSRAVSFDRTLDTYLSAGDVNDLANTDYTISAWVKRNTGVGKFDVVSKRNYFNENRDIDPGPDNDGNYTHGYAFRINSSNQFRMVWRDPADASNNIMQTSATIPEDEWHHIAATFDSSTNMTSLYIDGYLEDQDDTLDPMNVPSDAHFMIGAAHHIKRQQKHDGSVDEVRVWNVALTGDQIRYIMNQEIEQNASLNADGKVLPSATTKNEIVSVPWNNLIAYYPMSRMVFGSVKDESNSGNDASMINYSHLDAQTAPLPYQTTQNGDWDNETTWVNGDVQYLPGVDSYLDALETIDYNIVEISHNVTMDNSNTALIPADRNGNRTVLGLIVNSGDLQIDGNTATNAGYSLTVSHYLKLDGTIDLEGESQLIQTTDSDFDSSSSGSLERDQQGTTNTYRYNYWSSPVSPTSNSSYTAAGIISNVGFTTSGYDGNTSPVENADYWIWKYANNASNDYSQWQHVRSTGSILPGEGFTMKGPGTAGSDQNYVFSGQPNNGDISLTIAAGNDYLVGNPYPSALDANAFLQDNLGTTDGGNNPAGNIINGALYFWEHYAVDSHQLSDYQGGYATYTLMGGALAVNNDTRIDNDGSSGTKLPERYIPVGQGFFVSAILDTDLVSDPNDPGITQPIVGGSILFKNSQRVFQKENVSGSNTGSVFLKGKSKEKGQTTKTGNPVDDRQKIRIMFNTPDGYHRQLLVGVDERASNNFDLGFDGPLIEDNKEDLFWTLGNSKLIIQAVDNFNDTQVLPLGAKISKDGLATFSIDGLENIADNLDILLHDKELSVYHNLRESHYETFITAGEHLTRFELTFASSSSLLENEDITNENLQVYFSNEKESIIVLNPTIRHIETISLYNILGQSIINIDANTDENYLEVKTKNIKTGTYIIKMLSEDKMISKKVLIK
ncbi:LamG-like jellyroll fold domain-containing protein [Seonamhaeicola sp.]|uniref:LamG-like jellyroll fold domain-containing protein n=1 Tax=Seonamhaeicola sp. TaxID=1912245 RepID=UPI00262B7941|nr:LamG-like jellyroll fold domain-containing protein [Seonamhaeicola sp.]